MSHDPEAAEAIDQWLAMPQRPDRDTATDLLDYLAAAGYTVTRDRYEPARAREGEEEWWAVQLGDADGDLDWLLDPSRAECVPLYRKIEGSTDG